MPPLWYIQPFRPKFVGDCSPLSPKNKIRKVNLVQLIKIGISHFLFVSLFFISSFRIVLNKYNFYQYV